MFKVSQEKLTDFDKNANPDALGQALLKSEQK